MRAKFVDISRHNQRDGQRIDMARMKAQGVTGVWARASVGDYYLDPCFASYYEQAKELGLRFGAYYVTAPAATDNGRRITVKGHLDRLREAVGGREMTLPYVMDAELERGCSKAEITAINQGCILQTPRVRGIAPGIYTRQSWWDYQVLPWSGWKDCWLFAARYVSLASKMAGPWGDGYFKFRDWSEWLVWQRSADKNGMGPTYGVHSDSIDIDEFNGDDTAVQRWLQMDVLPAEIPVDWQAAYQALDVRLKEVERLVGLPQGG